MSEIVRLDMMKKDSHENLLFVVLLDVLFRDSEFGVDRLSSSIRVNSVAVLTLEL